MYLPAVCSLPRLFSLFAALGWCAGCDLWISDSDLDADGDGALLTDDCDDHDANVFDGNDEIPNDGTDNDCNPATPDGDLDGDGYASAVVGGGDCDDLDPSAYPDAPEQCDGKRNDCANEAWHDDAGQVSFIPDDGTLALSLSDSVAEGTSAAPAALRFDTDGAVVFCEGTYFVDVQIASDRFEARSGGGSSRLGVTLAPGVGRRVFTAETNSSLTLSGLTVVGTVDDLAAFSGVDRGGCLLAMGGDVVLRDVDFFRCAAAFGGAVYLQGVPNADLSNVVFNDNLAAESAGAMFLADSSATLDKLSLKANIACAGGACANPEAAAGAVAVQRQSLGVPDVVVTSSFFYRNEGAGCGGAIQAMDAAVEVVRTAFVSNVGRMGGAICARSASTLSVDASEFTVNVAIGGGAIYAGAGSALVASDSEFQGNRADADAGASERGNHGGAIWSEGGAVALDGCDLSSNYAGGDGGAIHLGEYLDIDDTSCCTGDACTFDQTGGSVVTNAAGDDGGGIHAERWTLALDAVTLTGNGAAGAGGAIEMEGGSVGTSACSFSSNAALLDGGAIELGAATFVDVGSAFDTNNAGDDGGAVDAQSGSSVDASTTTWTGNGAGDNGGALFLRDASTLSAMNVQIIANHAASDAGAIHLKDASTAFVSSSEIAENTADDDGGAVKMIGDANTPSTLSLDGCTTRANQAGEWAGFAYIDADGIIVAVDSTFEGNLGGTRSADVAYQYARETPYIAGAGAVSFECREGACAP